MGLSKETYELFDAYFRGELNEQESKDFEQKLSSDKEFSSDFEKYKLIIKEFEKKGDAEFINQLQEIDKTISDPVIIKNRKSPVWSIAASILVIIGIGSIFLITKDINPDKLYADHFQHYKNDLVEYSRGGVSDSPFEEMTDEDFIVLKAAMRHYDKKEYNQAIDIIEDILITNAPHPGIVFYLAVSQLEVNRLDEAIANFQFLINLPNHQYTQQAIWYIALSYLKNNELEKAKLKLKEIVLNNYYNSDQAEELLKSLD